MTNREWMNQASDKELAMFLISLSLGFSETVLELIERKASIKSKMKAFEQGFIQILNSEFDGER